MRISQGLQRFLQSFPFAVVSDIFSSSHKLETLFCWSSKAARRALLQYPPIGPFLTPCTFGPQSLKQLKFCHLKSLIKNSESFFLLQSTRPATQVLLQYFPIGLFCPSGLQSLQKFKFKYPNSYNT